MAQQGLVHGPLGEGCAHLCIDMQNVFMPGSLWGAPWMEKILPAVEELAGRHARQTIFTRFIAAQNPETAPGTWKRYYQKWESLTLDNLDPHTLELAPMLARLVPPATVIDKRVYSPWSEGRLSELLKAWGTRAVIVTGGETDVCVLATVLGAVDRGFRVIVAADAVYGSADETHDAVMKLYVSRFGQQVEIAGVDEILWNWRVN
jgi:nicotinamidase-related amidase